jgi:hypothetical protein
MYQDGKLRFGKFAGGVAAQHCAGPLEDGVRPSPMVLMSGGVAYRACLSDQVGDGKMLFAKGLLPCAHFSTCHTKVSC